MDLRRASAVHVQAAFRALPEWYCGTCAHANHIGRECCGQCGQRWCPMVDWDAQPAHVNCVRDINMPMRSLHQFKERVDTMQGEVIYA